MNKHIEQKNQQFSLFNNKSKQQCNTSIIQNQRELIFESYNSQAMSYVDDFIQKLNQTSPEIKALLREIRSVDYKSEKLQINIEEDRKKFLQSLKTWDPKRQASSKKSIQKKYKSILQNDKLLIKYSKDKVQLAQKLYNHVHQPTQKLDKQLHTRGEKYARVDYQHRGKKGKKKGRPTKQQWQNDPNQPKYCYCSKPSFGEMVMCQNTYCERQWFHRQCIEEKKLPEKWYCRECRGRK